MSATGNNQNGRSLFSLFRRGEKWKEVPPGYHVGDILSELPVAVLPQAEVVGNIFAPKITIAGFLYGSAAALETTIEAGGQIWGDVYTSRFQIDPGGKFEGWVNRLDEKVYQELAVDGLIPNQAKLPAKTSLELPPEAFDTEILARNENQIDLLRRLQVESAAALAARAELEREFEKRLNEVAGESAAKAISLHEELSQLRLELTNLREDRTQTREELRERNAQVERQANEIATTRELLTDQTERFNELQTLYEAKVNEHDQLTQAKTSLESDLRTANNQIDTLKDRIRSIESALQNSLQHSSEQEESLVRWQELAEVTEAKVQKLQAEVDNLTFQAQEHGRVTEMLRAQRKHAEEAWQEAMKELEDLRGKETKQFIPPEILGDLEAQIKQLQGKLALAEDKHREYKTRLAHMKSEQAAQTAIQQAAYEESLAKVQQDVQDARQEAQHSRELLLWDKANLESAQVRLEEARGQLETQSAQIAQLEVELQEKLATLAELEEGFTETETVLQAKIEAVEAELAQAQATADSQNAQYLQLQSNYENLQNELERLQNQSHELAAEIAAKEQHLAQAQDQLTGEKQQLKDILRETRSQLEAQEAEAENYYQQMNAQGQRLAEMQANLIEREIELKKVKTTAEKQAAFIQQMKTLSQERVGSLKEELDRTKKQLKQAVSVIQKQRAK
jgi:chromosome segregation ATPase